MMNRRSLLLGAGSLILAPAIVRAESLMPIFQVWTKTFPANMVDFTSTQAFWEKFLATTLSREEAVKKYIGMLSIDTFDRETLISVRPNPNAGPGIIQFPWQKVYVDVAQHGSVQMVS